MERKKEREINMYQQSSLKNNPLGRMDKMVYDSKGSDVLVKTFHLGFA